MAIKPESAEVTSERFQLFDFKQRLIFAFCVTLFVLIFDAAVLIYCYVGAQCQPWIEKFSGENSIGWEGAIIEFGRHATLVPLVAAILTFRFGVPIRHLFGSNHNKRVIFYRVFLGVLLVGVFVAVWSHHFAEQSFDSFGELTNVDLKKLGSVYKTYFWYSLIQQVCITIPLVFCPVYAISSDLARLSRNYEDLSRDIVNSKLDWVAFKKRFAGFKANCLTISIRYVDVLAILAISICYELIWGFSTLTPSARVVAKVCWFLTALSAITPMVAWLWFSQAYVAILKHRGEEMDVEWSQGNNCQGFVFSLFTASPGGVIAILLFFSLLQKGIDHAL